VVANYGNTGSSARVVVLRDDGTGDFTTRQFFTTGAGPTGIALADFDQDGWLDIATANYGRIAGSSTVSILRNDTRGGFALPQHLAVGAAPYRLVASDLDGDGRPDLVANSWSSGVEVLLSQGGGFAASRQVSMGPGTVDLAVGDWNRDGAIDLATSNTDAGLTHSSLSIALGRGDGSFFPATTQRSTYHIQYFNAGQLVALDADGDGDLDLAQGHTQSRDVSLFRNGGSGTFTRDARYGVGWEVRALAGGDFDADGFADLVAGTNTGRVALGVAHVVHLRGSGGQPWFTPGFGLPGSLGTPYLEGLAPFELPHPARLQLWLARPSSPGLLAIGTQRWNVPFGGGVLVPSLDLGIGFVTNAAGAASFAFPFP
jgi:hypothetical protein